MTLARRETAPASGERPPAVTLPIRTQELLGDVPAERTLDLERRHGNGDLIDVLDVLGIAGPFRSESPWELRDAAGRHLIHAGGYAAVPFGEGFPPLVSFLEDFLQRNRTMGLPQQSASVWRAALETNLVALLAAFAPSHADSRVLLSNSGAEAIEAALKMARAARPRGRTFLNFTRAYHGKTHGALALTPSEEYQAPFRPLAPRVETLPYGDLDALRDALRRLGDDAVAIVIEPIQGEAGAVVPPPGYLRGLGELAREHGVLVVADEIQSGLGRTGAYFASIEAGLEPDIVTLAKPLSGGLVPIGATIARRDVFRALLHGLDSKRHSSTFGGGTLAAAVATRALELLVELDLVERAREAGAYGLDRLRAVARRYPHLFEEVRGAGMLFALKLRPIVRMRVPGIPVDALDQFASALALRALHLEGVHACYAITTERTVRLTPPLNLPQPLLVELFDRVERVAVRHRRPWTMVGRLPPGRLLRLARMAGEPAPHAPER